MKAFRYFFLYFLVVTANIFGQAPVSGHISIEQPEKWENKVYLSRMDQKENNGSYKATPIATATINKDGFFAFDQHEFTADDRMYKIQLRSLSVQEKKKLSDKIKNHRLFIASKKDTIIFNRSKTTFGSYTTTNKADLEWRKLKKFNARFENLTSDFDTKQYLLETKGYVKDSLQILLVKLIGIKALDDRNLLEKDIVKNPKYYMDLLQELKSSELDPATYIYFENKLTVVNQELTNKKYHTSLWVNGIAIFVIVLLVSFIFVSKKKQNTHSPPLSKQEQIVKHLIQSGKSNKEIANELFVSISTVKTHISNIYSKLSISNRQELLSKK
ncbi:response regulator transcription factor [Aquimarina sp. AU474]|uniref:helix-turn-helix domain-containing protein n=1 Tax=Aquimarina sp. AU474 TaxID=2108529 RepID=UPI000D68BB07|nr:response regulator transcription factor [Aquimarina sp. AU474]